MSEPSVDKVIELLQRALRTELTLGELEAHWPRVTADDPLAEVRDDLESAIEHVPVGRTGPRSGLFRRATGAWQTDFELWRKSVEYGDLRVHLERLRHRR